MAGGDVWGCAPPSIITARNPGIFEPVFMTRAGILFYTYASSPDSAMGKQQVLMPLKLRIYLNCLCAACSLSLLLANPCALQASPSHSESVRQTYLPSDFAQFAPRSAFDLVKQIPGFSIDEGGDDRGFGQADTNVLINERRISGKSNGPTQALERLSVDSVIRIEILDGASLDIGGISGQVVNVVTASDKGITGLYRYSPRIRPTGNNTEKRLREFSVAMTGASNNSEWTLSVANQQRAFGESGYEIVSDSTLEITDRRFEESRRLFDRPNISGSYSKEMTSGSVFNLVGEVNGYYSNVTEKSERLTGTPEASTRVLKQSEDEYNFEIGADYEFSLGAGRLKLMGLHRFESSPTVDRTTTSNAEGATVGSIFSRQADEAESIVRAEFGFSAFDSQWRWSLEGAENSLDIESELDELNRQGEVNAIDLDGANSRVEETRVESTLNVSKRLNERLTLQATLGAEYSKISQTGSSDVTRDFVRPKGFLALNYKPTDTLFLSAKFERLVGQLSFFDFIASVDVNLDRENVTNVDLVPPQAWNLNIETQQSLGALGSLTLNLFYEDAEDIVDGIPIEGGGQAPGNIDTATLYGGFFDITVLSDELLWQGGRADLSLGYVNSKVADPIVGNDRKISDEFYNSYTLSVRQDFEDTPWALGASIDYEEIAPGVRIDEVSFYNKSPGIVNVYVENKDVKGLTIRFNVWNLIGSKNRYRRTVYADRLTDEVLFSESRSRRFGYSYTLTIEGAF